MRKILVSGASGVVGYGILRSLRGAGDYTLIGTTIYDKSVAPAFCDIFEKAPPTNSDGYINWLTSIIKKHGIDMVIPGIEDDMIKWNSQRAEITEVGTFPLLNNPDLIELCADKWNFYQHLKALGSKFVIESEIGSDFGKLKQSLGLPFLLKPRKGFGSKGISIVETEEDFNLRRADIGDKLMAQMIVGTNDEEYTVSSFFDKSSKLLCYMQLKRKLAREGYTETAEVVEIEGIEVAINELAALTKPVGPTNFQFRVRGGQLKLLEINPRISSATSIRSAFGYNESKISVEYFLERQTPTQPVIRNGYAVRYVEEKIFYDSNNI